MRRLKVALATVVLGALGLSGCGGTNNALATKQQQVEYYRIFDLKTNAGRQVIAKAATDGLGQNTGTINTAMPIPASAEPPEKPGRFKVVNPLAGSRLGMLAAAGGGLGMKMADCDGAVWTGNAIRKVSNSNSLNLWACLYPYKGGYHLDMYATFTKVEGGLAEISRQMAYAAVGTPEEWTEKTFTDVIRQIHDQTYADITYLEGYPDPGPLPWHDQGSRAAAGVPVKQGQ
ncbi:hypothetical protein ACCD06_32095 [Azospirillum sp. CT11-132]|uniref:hypothetical protein n=1 Tax=Azospirillum sp. CT11-132 TaxID=3396317 RepID=UPI000D606F06|nr:hypothetical protein TSH7_20600 [Azospirillum sp. TSH7]PWC64295.1 hypothetical protein TSH20_18600 [Azospirillum sp. TSH20]